MTIRRLELSAAVLAVKLDVMLRKELRLNIDSSVFWTDSMIVMHYIKNDSQRYQTFVANRVSQIREGSSPENWRHVESALNPADDASRGLDADQLITHQQWIQGPCYLWYGRDKWPNIPPVLKVADELLEVKKVQVNFVEVCNKEGCTDRLMKRYSSWYKLKKIVAWILRLKRCLLDRIRRKVPDQTISTERLSVSEVKCAEIEIVKYVQRNNFPEEIHDLNRGQYVKKTSSIKSVEPLMNSDGLLCVGGRLNNAPISVEAKHQLIIPKDIPIVTLIIRHHHACLGHSGKEHVLSDLRQKYWIISARRTIKRILRECIHCRRRQGQLAGQRMADLPEDRVTPDKLPFSYVGVDCFGPFMVKRGRSMVKRYGCLFTCLTTRAIHIEKIDSMDTDSFIDAMRRFEARRGKPEVIRSDNGSNFRGAQKELKEAIQSWNISKIEAYMLQKEIDWKFNPPSASHMGGIWERQIRTVHKVLSALLCHEKGLYDEGLYFVKWRL
jgi:hypothetical protein